MTSGSVKNQRGRILRILIDAHGAWVSLPEILALGIAQYGARILELRRQGFIIENRTEHVDGERHSWFRLVKSLPSVDRATAQKVEETDFMRRRREEHAASAPLFAEAADV